MSPERHSAEERRELILQASLELFARQGLHGVTTRMIAEAAGMSEALLYRHFRSKDELYRELQRWCLRGTIDAAEKLAQLPAQHHHPGAGRLLRRPADPRPTWGPRRHRRHPPDHARQPDRRWPVRARVLPGQLRPLPAQAGRPARGRPQGRRHRGPRGRRTRSSASGSCTTPRVMAGNMYLPDRPVVDHGVDRQDAHRRDRPLRSARAGPDPRRPGPHTSSPGLWPPPSAAHSKEAAKTASKTASKRASKTAKYLPPPRPGPAQPPKPER